MPRQSGMGKIGDLSMAERKGVTMNKRNPNNRQREIISNFESVFSKTDGIENSIKIVEDFLETQNNKKCRRSRK